MGFYIRKALKVGPLRFNLSKSGIGVSAGIKGCRLGTGPRGNYVHMGRGGLYYRKTLPSGASKNTSRQSETQPDQLPQFVNDPLEQIESSSVQGMTDSSSEALLEELNKKKKKFRLLPIVTIASGIGLILISNAFTQSWMALVAWTVLLGLIYLAYLKDQLNKSTVLFYELEPEVEQRYEALHTAFDSLASCRGRWHIEAHGEINDRKRNAGASGIVKRDKITLTKKAPPFVKTNISAPNIPVGKRTLYFFPDKILVYTPDGIGAVSYKQLALDIEPTKFIETESVPQDAEIVDRTWQYVNKSGGPDKRFSNNPELPVVLYEYIHFTSETGLSEKIQISKTGLGRSLQAAITDLSQLAEVTQPNVTTIATSTTKPKEVTNESKPQQDWFARGKQYFSHGEYKMAITAFSRVIESDPNNADTYYQRAAAYSKMRDKEKTIADLKNAAQYGHPKAQAYLSEKGIV